MSLRGGNTPHDYYDADWQFVDLVVPEKRYGDPATAGLLRLATEVVLSAFRSVIANDEDAERSRVFLMRQTIYHEFIGIEQPLIRRILKKIEEHPETIKTRYNICINRENKDVEEDQKDVGALSFDGEDSGAFEDFAGN